MAAPNRPILALHEQELLPVRGDGKQLARSGERALHSKKLLRFADYYLRFGFDIDVEEQFVVATITDPLTLMTCPHG